MIYALIKDGMVQNTIIADQDFIDSISSDWDHCVRVDEMDPQPGIDCMYDGSEFSWPVIEATLESEESAGGNAVENMMVAGLLATDVLQSIAIKTMGANSVNILSQAAHANGAIEVTFDGDPGAGLVLEIVVNR